MKRGKPNYITKKIKDVDDNNFIFTYTIMDKIYINLNGNEISIDMEDLNITGDICDFFSIDRSQGDHGIFSTSIGVYHKKTDYTKHLSVKCNINNSTYVTLKLGSDISLNDFNNMAISFYGIDIDGVSGCFVSEKTIIKLDYLTQLKKE